ncbi:MAG: Tfp pilus assembly protein PilF, partial [Gammaproteobacteria bacterium]
QMGEPDLVVSMPIAFEVPAAGDDIFRNFVLPVEIVGTHYVQAMEIRPDNRLVVHHASMAADRSRQARRKDAEEEGLGFGGIEIFSETDEPNGFFMTYKPGTISNPGRPEMSWRVDGRTDLVLNVHLQPTGKPESLRVDVGLYFAQSPPTLHPFLLRLDNDRAIDIPPGEAEFIVTDEFVLPIDVQVLGAYPHMHFLGKNVECYATLPDGSRQNLIEIPTWDFYWQASYSYKEPVFLPAGTKISMQLTFDNSADNPLNPHSPPQRILSGNRSADEMARLALRVLPEDKSGAFVLQAEMMRARLRKDPTSADSRTRLGNALRSLGQNERAIRRYREAAQINPSDFLSRNNLAGLLWETGQPEEAEQELLSILEASPDYLKAHENLAFMLSARGALDEAQAHLERMLELDSELADVHHKLGRLHARAKRPKEARTSFLAALQVDPAHIGATFDLGSLLASLGQFSQAIERFEYVLVLDPGHDGARQNLVRVRELDK